MAVDHSEDSTPLINNKMLLPIRVGYKHIHLYPYPFGVCIFLFMLHRIFPPLFFFILRCCPVFAITSLLLAALLTYGKRETNCPESCSRNNNSQINSDLKCYQSSYHLESEEKSENQPSSYQESEEKSENQHDEKRNPEKERFRRLTSLIERRRTRMTIRHEIKRNLDPDAETLVDDPLDFGARVSPVYIPKRDPFSDKNEDCEHVPGSAPSILHHRKTAFQEFLPGATRFSRLDPFLVTEMDLAEGRDATSSLVVDHANIRHVHGVESQDDPKELKLRKSLSIRGMRGTSVVTRDVNMPQLHGDSLGTDSLNADNSQLKSKEEILAPADSSEENGTSSYCDTILLSEYLNLCSSGILPPQKTQTPPASFPLDKFEESEIKPREEKVKYPSDGTNNGVCDASALDLEHVEAEVNAEQDENLELEEHEVNNVPDDSHNFVSDTKELALDSAKIAENVEYDENLEFEEDPSSVKEVKSILKQIRQEIVKAESNLGVFPEIDHEANSSVRDETGMKVLSDPKFVEERKMESEENGSGTSETDVTPDSLLERSPLSESIASNLKILRKQNKHGDSSSASSDDFY